MAAIIADNFRIDNAVLFKESFGVNNYFMTIGRVLPWEPTEDSPLADDNNPPVPSDSVDGKITAWREMIGAKKIQQADVSLVIPRIDWVTGTVYDEYSSADGELYQKDFYVINSVLDVYKVISNNFGASSTVEPTGTSTTIFQTGDGYRWKFMYSVAAIDANKFLTPQYIPIKFAVTGDGSAQADVQDSAVEGQIVSYRIIDGGTGYASAPALTVVGDGTGATATAGVSGGEVVSIVVTGLGQDYTYAEVQVGGPGSGAVIAANIAPEGGHGSSAVYELGAYYVSMVARLEYSESGNLSTSNDYRRIAIVRDPFAWGTTTDYVASLARQTFALTVDSALGFQVDEIVTGNTSNATGTVVEVDTVGNIIYVTDVKGIFVAENISGSVSMTVAAVSSIDTPDLQPNSGKMVYIETIKPQPRDDAQIEKISSVVEW